MEPTGNKINNFQLEVIISLLYSQAGTDYSKNSIDYIET